MKVVHIYGNIINCDEIRNVQIIHTIVRVFFKKTNEHIDIICQSRDDAEDVMDIIYNEMVGE